MTISPRAGPPRPLLVGRQSDVHPPRSRGESGWNNRGGLGRSQSFRNAPPRERGRSASPGRQFEDAPMDEGTPRLGLSFDSAPPAQSRGLSLKDRLEPSGSGSGGGAGGGGRPPLVNGVHPDRVRLVPPSSQRNDTFVPDSRPRRQTAQEYDGPTYGYVSASVACKAERSDSKPQ